jgi:hypothetical protein
MDEFESIIRDNGIEDVLVEAFVDSGDPCPF